MLTKDLVFYIWINANSLNMLIISDLPSFTVYHI